MATKTYESTRDQLVAAKGHCEANIAALKAASAEDGAHRGAAIAAENLALASFEKQIAALPPAQAAPEPISAPEPTRSRPRVRRIRAAPEPISAPEPTAPQESESFIE